MADESNGESTFEFVDKKPEENVVPSGETKAESISSWSSSASMLTSLGITTSVESLLTSVSPPMALPSFITSSLSSFNSPSPVNQEAGKIESPKVEVASSVGSDLEVSTEEDATQPEIVEEAATGTSLFSWVKENVVNSNVLSKVAEKAKNSVNSMITTLDPQMREFICEDSGGDVEIIVASDKETKIAPIREAAQNVFGKATVSGIAANPTMVAAQPVGFSAGVKGAEERIFAARTSPKIPIDAPVIAVENFLLEIAEDKWYDLGVLVLSDPKNDVSLQTFTQMTPVPSQIVGMAKENTPTDYPHSSSGFSITIGSLMAQNLQVPHNEWHEALTGISRRDIILLAAQSLIGIYKNTVNSVQ